MENYFDILRSNEKTLIVLCDNKIVYSSNEFGVIPLLKFELIMDSNKRYTIIDKLTGAAAARMLIAFNNIEKLYSSVITTEAKQLLSNNDISVEFEKEVANILNRKKDDLCPIEKISKSSDDYVKLHNNLLEFYESINIKIGS